MRLSAVKGAERMRQAIADVRASAGRCRCPVCLTAEAQEDDATRVVVDSILGPRESSDAKDSR